MTKHYQFGGSTADRTLACPRWHDLSKNAVRGRTSFAAQLGTALHSIIEQCTNDETVDPFSFANTRVEGVSIERDHIAAKIVPALECIDEYFSQYNLLEYWCELEFKLSERVGGTADFIGLSEDRKTLVVADYKSGDGNLVYAENNAQGLFYAMCALLAPTTEDQFNDVDVVVIAIVQPSVRKPATSDTWTVTRSDVLEFAAKHMHAVEQAELATIAPCAGDHCMYCPAQALGCPAKQELITHVQALRPAQIAAADLPDALHAADELEGWCAAVRRLAHDLIERGVSIDGYKLVHKRANRYWCDNEPVRELIKHSNKIRLAEAYETKLRSPAQLEKLCKAKGTPFERFAPHVSSISKGTSLVKNDDSREAIIKTDAQKILDSRF